MKNPATIATNIAERFAKEFGRNLTDQELVFVKEASREALGKIRGRIVRKLVTEKIGTGNGLCRFEDIASGRVVFDNLRDDIRHAVHKEVVECILEIAEELGPRIGNSAIEFVKEWGDTGDYEHGLKPLVTPKDNPNAAAQRRWRKNHPDAVAQYMRELRKQKTKKSVWVHCDKGGTGKSKMLPILGNGIDGGAEVI